MIPGLNARRPAGNAPSAHVVPFGRRLYHALSESRAVAPGGYLWNSSLYLCAGRWGWASSPRLALGRRGKLRHTGCYGRARPSLEGEGRPLETTLLVRESEYARADDLMLDRGCRNCSLTDITRPACSLAHGVHAAGGKQPAISQPNAQVTPQLLGGLHVTPSGARTPTPRSTGRARGSCRALGRPRERTHQHSSSSSVTGRAQRAGNGGPIRLHRACYDIWAAEWPSCEAG